MLIILFLLTTLLTYHFSFFLLDQFDSFLNSFFCKISDNFGEIPKKEVYTLLFTLAVLFIIAYHEKKNITLPHSNEDKAFRSKKYYQMLEDFGKVPKDKRKSYIKEYKAMSLKHGMMHYMTENIVVYDLEGNSKFYKDLINLNFKYNLPLRFILTDEFLMKFYGPFLNEGNTDDF